MTTHPVPNNAGIHSTNRDLDEALKEVAEIVILKIPAV
jgi:hypothetical protein